MPEFDTDLLPSAPQQNPVDTFPHASGATKPVPQATPQSYFRDDSPAGDRSSQSLQDLVDSYDSQKEPNQANDIQGSITNKELKDNSRYSLYRQGANNEDIASQNQSGWKELANAGVNLVAKTVGYTAQAAGFILGAPVALASWDMSNMTDNWLTKAADYVKEGVQDNFPIYKPDKYTQGSIWQKLTSSQWWADDAIDRLALTISMFVPAIAESKGVGLFGTVADAGGGIRATGIGAKAIESLADNPGALGGMGKTFLPKLYKAATTGAVDDGVNPALATYARSLTKAELYSWNVIGQSALNAKETGDGIRKNLQEARDRGDNAFTDTEIEQKASDGKLAAFWQTIPVTLAGSLVELPQMFSTARNTKSMLNKLYNSETGEQLLANAKDIVPSLKKTISTALLTGLEHGQNESMQVAISRYNEDRNTIDHKTGKPKDVRGAIQGIFGDFLDNINDPNGQNNIALGTIQGIFMTLGGRAKASFSGELKNEQQQASSIMEQVAQAKLNMRYYNIDFTQKNEKGNVITDDKGVVQLDQQKLADAGVSLAGLQNTIQLRAQLAHDGNYARLNELNHRSVTAIARNFFDDPNGMDHLRGIMTKELESAKKDPNRLNDFDEYGNEIPADQQLARNLEIVNKAKKIYDAIDQRHAGFMSFDIDRKQNDEIQLAHQKLSELKNAQYNEGVNQQYIVDALAANERGITSLAINAALTPDSKIDSPSSPAEQQINDLLDEKIFLGRRLEKSKADYKQLIDKKAQKDFFADDIGFLRGVNINPPKTEEENSDEKPTDVTKSGATDTLLSHFAQAKETNPNLTGTIEDYKNELTAPSEDVKPVVKSVKEDIQSHIDNIKSQIEDERKQESPDEDKIQGFNNDIDKLKELSGHIDEFADARAIEDSLTGSLGSELIKQQGEIIKSQPADATGENVIPIREDKKKTLYQIRNSTSEPSEPTRRKPWMDRHQRFLSKIRSFKNKNSIQAIKITKNNEAAWGLNGLIDAIKKPGATPEELVSANKGTVLIMYVNKEKDGSFSLVDKKGKNIKPEDVTHDNVVFSTMSDTDKTWDNGKSKYRANETEFADAAFEQYEADRAELFKITSKEQTRVYSFKVSDGKAILDENKGAQNPVVGSILSDIKELNDRGILQVSTTGTITNKNGDNLTVPKGRPVLVTSSGISFLNNRLFTLSEAENLTNVLKLLAKKFHETKVMDDRLVRYLSGQFQWMLPKPGVPASNSQMYYDEISQNIVMGTTPEGKPDYLAKLHPDDIEKNRDKIEAIIQNKWNNVNNKYLTTEFDHPYEELSVNKDGTIIPTVWKTYQHYLLSPKLPNEKGEINSKSPNRLSVTPLYTQIRMVKPDSVVEDDFSFQRYSVLEDKENPEVKTPIKEAKEKAKKPKMSKEDLDKRLASLNVSETDKNVANAVNNAIPALALNFIDENELTKKENMQHPLTKKSLGERIVPDEAAITKQNTIKENANKLEELIKCLISG